MEYFKIEKFDNLNRRQIFTHWKAKFTSLIRRQDKAS